MGQPVNIAGGSNRAWLYKTPNDTQTDADVALADLLMTINKSESLSLAGKPGDSAAVFSIGNKAIGLEGTSPTGAQAPGYDRLINKGRLGLPTDDRKYIIKTADLIVTQTYFDGSEDEVTQIPSNAETALFIFFDKGRISGLNKMWFLEGIITGDSGNKTWGSGALVDAPLEITSIAAQADWTLTSAIIADLLGTTGSYTPITLDKGSYGSPQNIVSV